MTKIFFKITIAGLIVLIAAGVLIFLFFPPPWNAKKGHVEQIPQLIIPRSLNSSYEEITNTAEYLAQYDSMSVKIPLEEGEIAVSVLTDYFDGGPVEKQFVAYRSLLEPESAIYVTFIDYDEALRDYKRVWSAKTAASRPGTVNLYTKDILGDKSLCVLLHGMNSQGENTLTIFRKNPALPSYYRIEDNNYFVKIAEISIDGTIDIQTQVISAFGRDHESSNLLDQIEIQYIYNWTSGLFEQTRINKIPGAQVEQRRVRELLSDSKVFEEFISGLWNSVTPQGNINKNQYIFFSPSEREIIFYSDETQQVFIWQNSYSTRYGIYIQSQNISVTTLRRAIDIELESLESIKIRVKEDVHLNLGVSAPFDGSYKKAGSPEGSNQALVFETPFINAMYDGSIGKIRFQSDGSFELNSGGLVRQGKYAFFYLNDQQLLELRSPNTPSQEQNSKDSNREIYLVEGGRSGSTLTLVKIKLGAKGISRQNERPLLMTLVSE